MLLIICRRAGVLVRNTLRPSVLGLTECHSWLSPFLSNLVAVTNGTRIRINVLRINDLRSTLTSIRFIELYINNREYDSETQGLPSSEIEIILLIIGRRAGVFVRNTLRPSVLGLTECHSCQEPISRILMRESRVSVPGTNGTRIRINVLRINDLRSTLTSIRFIELYINNTE